MIHYSVFTMLGFFLLGLASAADHPAKLKDGKVVKFQGKIEGELDLSGGVIVGKFLVIVSNEAHGVQVLKETSDGDYKVIGDIVLAPKGTDLDLEAVTAEGNMVYVVGSHSRLRSKGTAGELGAVEVIPTRDRVFRFPLDADGKHGKIDTVSLRKVLDSDAVLKAFVPIASKENGIDIEGLAVKAGKLYFGFRGPVLRDNWVPVLVGEFDKLEKAELRYVQLGGRGIRDLVPYHDGFLILAGPMGANTELGYQIYRWDGGSGLPLGEKASKVELLDAIPSSAKHRPEGLVVLKDKEKATELLLIHDGVAGGDPTRMVLEWKK